MVNAATPVAVNHNDIFVILDEYWFVGFMWEGGGEAYTVCLFFRYSFKLGKKALTVLLTRESCRIAKGKRL